MARGSTGLYDHWGLYGLEGSKSSNKECLERIKIKKNACNHDSNKNMKMVTMNMIVLKIMMMTVVIATIIRILLIPAGALKGPLRTYYLGSGGARALFPI